MKNEIIKSIKELSYEDALEIRNYLNEHISNKELFIKSLINQKSTKLKSVGLINKTEKVKEYINEHNYKCVVCGNIGLISHGIDSTGDEFDDTLHELYSCENNHCKALYKREISKDLYEDYTEIVLYKR